ncbi:tape measure protein [Rhizobium sp. WW_1]|jgi:tape measure domain-containing protein|uniref:tape measure protein n=1 Tax=Rhizobium sp. WW_1 TaxID=1907375 RepID=UPI00068A478F|nr:tape measure protein [Rhizobium sp. WW_1]RKD61558.1 tape measure domain-containing protein [Rhizobium sp. WW_1]
MATDVEKLVVQLSADIKQYQREMMKARDVTNSQARAIEARFRKMNANIDNIGRGAAKSLIAPLAGVGALLSVNEVMKYADAWTAAKNSLAVAGVVGTKQVNVLDQLYASAQKNSAPIGALTSLFGKAAQASDNLGASQSELLRFSDGVATALRVAGTSSTEASGALTQLGQLLGQARVQAEEFNSVNEGARPILMAVANGLDAAGGSVSKLKQLVNAGSVTGKEFFQAFLKGLPSIQAMAANATETISQGFTKVDNALTKYIGQTDSSLGASQRLVQGLNALADNFDVIADTTLKVAAVIAGALVGRAIGGMVLKLAEAGVAVGRFVTAIKAARTAASVGTAIAGISAAAGPIGAVIGVGATVALGYFADSAIEASARTDRLKQEMQTLGIYAGEMKPKIDNAAEAIKNLAPEETRKRLKDIADEMERIKGRSWSEYFGFSGPQTLGDIQNQLELIRGTPFIHSDASDADKKAAKDLQEVILKALDGKNTLEALNSLLDDIAKTKPSQPIDEMIASLRKLLPQMESLKRYTAVLKRDLPSMTTQGPEQTAGPAGSSAQDRAYYQQQQATQKGLDKRTAESQKSQAEKELDKRTLEVAKAVKDLGGAISDASARMQAKTELANEKSVQAYDGLISGFSDRVIGAESSGNPTIKNDKSTAMGLGQFIEKTWLNLFKKYFPDEAATLTDPAILALRSNGEKSKVLIDAYARENAKLLQQAGISVVDAADEYKLQLAHFLGPQGAANLLKAPSGTLASKVLSADAVRANPTILGRGATVDDVIAYGQKRAGMSTAGTKRLEDRADYDNSLKQQQQQLDQLKEETGLRAALNPLLNDNGKALSTLQKAQELLNLAQEHGTAAGRELTSAQQLLNGDLSKLTPAAQEQALAMRALAVGYGEADAGANRLAESQDKLRQKVEDWRDFSKDATKGFIQDLIDGKSAAEALGNVLEKIGSKLLDLALNDLFGSSGSTNWFSNLFHADGGPIKKLASGGHVIGPGGPRSDKVPAMLSDGEFVVNAAATQKNRALLEAINGGRQLMLANGGIVRAPRMPNAAVVGSAARMSGPQLTYAPQIDARGADAAAVARLEKIVEEDRRDFNAKAIAALQKANKSRVKGI